MKYSVCCKQNGHEYCVFEDEKEAKAKAKRFTIQRLTCEKCGGKDWVVVEKQD